jgi:nucleoside-diphosphate-sugar epimerase
VSRYFASNYQVPVTIVRPFNVYGPGQAAHFLIPTLLRQALEPGAEAFVVDDGRPKRDYLFVDDLVNLLIRLMERGAAGTYNAGAGYSVGIRDLTETINRVAGTSKPLVSRERSRPDEVLDVVADISKAAGTGWAPMVTMEEGLRRMLQSHP